MNDDLRRWVRLVESTEPKFFYTFVKGSVARVLPDDTPDIWSIQDDGWEFVWDSARTEAQGYAFALKNHHAYPEGEKPPALIDTPGFRQWFGQSKCIDKRGKPLRVYHGSFHNYDQFKYLPHKGVGAAGWGFNRIGFWFDSHPRTPNEFANGEGGNVQPVYLSVQNPLVLQNEPVSPEAVEAVRRTRKEFLAATEANRIAGDDYGVSEDRRHKALRAYRAAQDVLSTSVYEPFNQLMARLPKYDRKASPEVRKAHTDDVVKVQAALIAEGYDGIILRDTLADAGSRDWNTTDWWIVFRPNQIKSAVSNSGRFDPDDERLSEGQ